MNTNVLLGSLTLSGWHVGNYRARTHVTGSLFRAPSDKKAITISAHQMRLMIRIIRPVAETLSTATAVGDNLLPILILL